MRSLPFGSRFGGAFLLDSLDFFDTEEENLLVLRELLRVLLPRGRLILAVANATPIIAKFRAHDVERRGALVLEIARRLERDGTQMVEAITMQEGTEATH